LKKYNLSNSTIFNWDPTAKLREVWWHFWQWNQICEF